MASRKAYLEQESQREMNACILLGSTSAPDILQKNGLDETWPSFEYKRNKKREVIGQEEVKVRGQDVFSLATWKKFLVFFKYDDHSLISLTDDEHRLTEQLYTFLTTSHTDRYANLDVDGLTWLRKTARLAVTFHLMRNKAAGYLQSLANGVMEEDYICNPLAIFCYQLTQLAKLSNSGVARTISHIAEHSDDTERVQGLIKVFFDEHYGRIFELIKILGKDPTVPEFQQLAARMEGAEVVYE